MSQQVNIGISGASGVQYALRLIEDLLQKEIDISLMISKAAKVLLSMEMGLNFNSDDKIYEYFGYSSKSKSQFNIYSDKEWTAPLASGTGINGPVVIVPCSMGILSAIAVGASDNLMERACDVAIKENKQLILVPRETPISAIHLENMLKLSRMGVCILPANPGFYHNPKTIEDLIDFVVARILDQLNIGHDLIPKWGS